MQFFSEAPGMILTLLAFEILLLLVLIGRGSRSDARGSVLPRAYLENRALEREPLGFHDRLGM